jgi:hypothetical protein
MAPFVASRTVPEGIYRIHSFLFPDFCLEQPLASNGTFSLVRHHGGKASEVGQSLFHVMHICLSDSSVGNIGPRDEQVQDSELWEFLHAWHQGVFR